MSKKISLVDIKNDNKVYSQKKRIELDENSHAFIYPHFAPSKQAELIKEMITDSQRAKEAGIDFDKINMADWSLFNIIYKFADLGIPSEIKKKVQAFYLLVDWKYFGKIIESFPQESIDEFTQTFLRFSENFKTVLEGQGVSVGEIEEFIKDENNIVN